MRRCKHDRARGSDASPDLELSVYQLRRDEFMAVMVDPRIEKILIEDEDTGELIAMCTLTNQLETVDWVSPEYFAHHYPDHWERGAVFYLGFSLVASRRRRAQRRAGRGAPGAAAR